MSDPLVRAAAELEQDARLALALMLEAWRACRAPELANAIEELGVALPPAPPLAAKGGVALRTELNTRIDADAPSDFDMLASVALPRSLNESMARLRRLAERSPDPRFASLLHRLIDTPPSGQPAFWREIFQLVVVAGDPRSIDRLSELEARLPALARPSSLEMIERRRADAVAALRATYRKPPKLSAGQTKALAAIATAVHARNKIERGSQVTGDELLAAIRRDPDDDRPRVVYADWLQERGDPRGELIALQLANADARRIRELVAEHGKAWLGPIASVAVHAQTRFERGFPVAVTINPRNERFLAATIGSPEWFSVNEITFSGMFAESLVCAELLAHPIMRGVSTVRGLGTTVATRVAAAATPLSITTIYIRGAHVLRSPEFVECRGLPRLEAIVIAPPGVLRDLIEATALPIAKRMRVLGFTNGPTTLELRDGLSELRIDLADPGKIGLARGEIDRLAAALPGLRQLEIVTDHEPDSKLQAVLGPLWRLPRSIVRRPRA